MHIFKAWVRGNNIMKGKLIVFALSNLKRTIKILKIKLKIIVQMSDFG